MRLKHSAITSSIYELVKVVEFNLTLGETWPMRFEIFRDVERPGHFRCRIWQLEQHELQPTYPQDEKGRPLPDHLYDPMIAVDYTFPGTIDFDDIVATDADATVEAVVEDFKKYLEHVTGERAE
jgi:hypothetical protein